MRGQEQGEEAAAVIFPLGVVWGFTFISPKRRGAGEGRQGSKGRKAEREQELECRRRKSRTKGPGEREAMAEQRSLLNVSFPPLHGLWTLHPFSLPAAPPVLLEVLSVICKMWFNL